MKKPMTVTVEAPAKINLSLDITGRREDGYHLIETVMQAIDLCDRVTVRHAGAPGAIRLGLTDQRIPGDSSNTAYRAAQAFFAAVRDKSIQNPGICISIDKRIPMQAGLAGGSADAAGTLAALNRLTDARLTDEELCLIGAGVGADVPFCILGGAAFAEGTGTILSPLQSMPSCHIVVAKPDCGVSTPEAYRRIDSAVLRRRPHTSVVADALCAADLDTLSRELCNVFEEALGLPEVGAIKQVMRDHETLGCCMTGSGSAVFGLFGGETAARRCAAALKRDYEEVYVCHPCPHGPAEET
jgi:4-diphosphocytidyl-2-C-methyl-D-erythritol kinase